MRRDHQQFRNNKENKRAQKKKGNDKEDKFKLWKEGPNFDTDLRQNVYAQEGQTAVLTCRVYDRGNKTVRQQYFLQKNEFDEIKYTLSETILLLFLKYLRIYSR